MANIGKKSYINKTIKNEEFHIKKKFGQNFLVDQNILQKIVEVPSYKTNTLAIEIGPGMGSLTEHLLQEYEHVMVYEIDSDLIPILQNTFDNNEITIIHDDFLKRNIDEDIKALSGDFEHVILVANLPYYITTPIIMKVLEESNLVAELIIMVQLEVAKRLTSSPSTKDYNSLSVVIQYKTEASIAFKVPKTVFVPEPNVDSAVVHLKALINIEDEPHNEDLFYRIVRKSFSQRRKTLVNNLHNEFGFNKEEIGNLIGNVGLKANVRAEHLRVKDFVRLADEFDNYIKRK